MGEGVAVVVEVMIVGVVEIADVGVTVDSVTVVGVAFGADTAEGDKSVGDTVVVEDTIVDSTVYSSPPIHRRTFSCRTVYPGTFSSLHHSQLSMAFSMPTFFQDEEASLVENGGENVPGWMVEG